MTNQETTYPFSELFDRNYGMFTETQQELLRNATIAIAGVGGVGGTSAELAARCGFGKLVIADPETYEATNCNRQIGATTKTLGRLKADVIEERCKDINPHLQTMSFTDGINEGNIERFLSGADIIIDAIDYQAPGARLLLYSEAQQDIISVPAIGYGSLVMHFVPGAYNIKELFDAQGSQFRNEKLLAGADNTPTSFFERLKQGGISTYPPIVYQSGLLGVDEAIATIFHRAYEQGEQSLEEYCGNRDLTIMPYATRVDLGGRDMKRINLEEVGRNEE
jgi:molybdopterin/thiamine biosynthesis adenylyltransferase